MNDAPILVRVVAPHFVAGFEIENGVVVRAAPIIKHFIGLTTEQARTFIASKGSYRAFVVSPAKEGST